MQGTEDTMQLMSKCVLECSYLGLNSDYIGQVFLSLSFLQNEKGLMTEPPSKSCDKDYS